MNNQWPEKIYLGDPDDPDNFEYNGEVVVWGSKRFGLGNQEYVISHLWHPINTLPNEEGEYEIAYEDKEFDFWDCSSCIGRKGPDGIYFFISNTGTRSHRNLTKYSHWTHWRQRCINPPEVNHD